MFPNEFFLLITISAHCGPLHIKVWLTLKKSITFKGDKITFIQFRKKCNMQRAMVLLKPLVMMSEENSCDLNDHSAKCSEIISIIIQVVK